MAKKFVRQEYFRYPRLGMKWRKPKGHQSKMRREKGGSGLKPKIGYKSPQTEIPVIQNINDLEKHKGKKVLLASQMGLKKKRAAIEKAQELGITLLNAGRQKKRIKKLDLQFKMNMIKKKEKKATDEKKESKAAKKEPKSETEKPTEVAAVQKSEMS